VFSLSLRQGDMTKSDMLVGSCRSQKKKKKVLKILVKKCERAMSTGDLSGGL
jgi:hypothetical protein